MTFLNPFVLFGLVAAAIPLILHLLNLRKLRTIEFSTLTFLKELQQTKIRRLKLRQILLLIVRTLLIILIVLAFARPALRGTILGTIGTNAHTSVVFILDDSFSMTAGDEHGEYFRQAKDATVRLIDLLKDGDEAYLVKLSDLPRATIDPATHDFSALRKVVNESEVSPIRRQLDNALRLSANLLQRSRNANKEIYVVSDMQATLLDRHANLPANFSDSPVTLFAVEIGTKAGTNAGVDSVSVKTTILERDKPTTMYCSLRNFSGVPLNNYVVSVDLDGARLAQRSVSAEPWGSAAIDLEAVPKHAGFIKGYVELEHDATEQDDRRYFSFYIPERIAVAVVGNVSADCQFIRLALQASMGGRADSSLLNIQQTSVQKFPLLDLKNLDVLVIADLTTLSTADAQKIRSFVERGGGLVLFPQASLSQTGVIASPLLSALTIPQVDRVSTFSPGNGISFQKVDLDHPLFATIFEHGQPGQRQEQQRIESPGISISLNRQTGKHGRTIIAMTDGSSFLSEHTLGNGKIVFFSVSPVLAWSDFPLNGIFAPLIHRSVVYTSSRSEVIPSYIVGDEPTVNVQRPGSGNAEYSLVHPDGTEELLQPAEQSSTNLGRSSLSFTLKRLDQPGFYQIRSGKTPLTVFAANVDALESDMRKMTQDDVSKAIERLGIPSQSIQFVEPGDKLQAAILQSRFGVELWRYCIAVALLLALVEMMIARDSRKAMQAIPA